MNPRLLRAVVLAVTALGVASPAPALEHSETVARSFTIDAGDGRRSVVVDNVQGSILIEAWSQDTVELTLRERYEARSESELARARQEVQLEIKEGPGALELSQGGPWRCRRRDGGCEQERRSYEVRFDWTLRVPRDIDLVVKNVNDGAVRVRGTVGRLEVSHVNDDVTLERVSGQVDARTVNGALQVTFDAPPDDDCRFGTVNGDIDLTFPKGAGAQLSFATLNGEVYTDFPCVLASPKATSERSTSGKRQRHELGRTAVATIGAGGIGLDCRTVNGDIYVRERS